MNNWLELFYICLAANIGTHLCIKKPLRAFWLSVGISTAVLPVLDIIHKGYLDGWWPIACITIGIYCALISAPIAGAVFLIRKYGKQ